MTINIAEQENMMKINQPFARYKITSINHNNEDIISHTKLILGLSTTNSYSDLQKELIKMLLAKIITIMNGRNKIQL